MEIDIEGKALCIFGLPGTGKSTLRDSILNLYGAQAVLYDTLWETPKDAPYYSYRPKDRYSVAELERVTGRVIAEHYKLFCIEETNRFCPSKPSPLPKRIVDLNDMRRKDAGHYGIGVIYMSRRLVQLNQDLTELADYLAIFHLTGKNDIQYLDDLVQGLGQVVLNLPDFHFVFVNRDRSYSVMSPIEPSAYWLNK
jgi:hypothetical protein